MTLNAKNDLAMILPLPVKTPAAEQDVEFVDLKECPTFFSDLDKGFLVIEGESVSLGVVMKNAAPKEMPKLKVVPVGNFEASFVPTEADFSRLDERFRLPPEAWKKLPAYKTYGFAVFKLKPGATTVHPMAFYFRRIDLATLFFPTVHIHDGKVHAKAHFDHTLYCQPTSDERPAIEQWEESLTHPAIFMQVEKTHGIIQGNQHCYKKQLKGSLPNRDTLLKIEG